MALTRKLLLQQTREKMGLFTSEGTKMVVNMLDRPRASNAMKSVNKSTVMRILIPNLNSRNLSVLARIPIGP